MSRKSVDDVQELIDDVLAMPSDITGETGRTNVRTICQRLDDVDSDHMLSRLWKATADIECITLNADLFVCLQKLQMMRPYTPTDAQKEAMELDCDIIFFLERDYTSSTIGTVKKICKRLDNIKDPFMADLWNDPFSGECESDIKYIRRTRDNIRQIRRMRDIITENEKDEVLLDKELADFVNEIHARNAY